MDTTELRECTNDRLHDLEQTLRRQIFEAKIKNFTNQLDDTASIRRAKKDLARVKTILSERALAGAEEAVEPEEADVEETSEDNAADEAEESE